MNKQEIIQFISDACQKWKQDGKKILSGGSFHDDGANIRCPLCIAWNTKFIADVLISPHRIGRGREWVWDFVAVYDGLNYFANSKGETDGVEIAKEILRIHPPDIVLPRN